MFDGAINSPIWVAERLQGGSLLGGAQRHGLEFQDDPQLPRFDLARHYKRSGYDRGHLAPAADFRWSQEAMRQSFITSNAVPQHPIHNREIWAHLESMVREMASRRGALVVVTGPIFAEPVRWLHAGQVSHTRYESSVPIPAALFKVIVDPSSRDMTGFVIPNEADQGDDPGPFQVSVRHIEGLTGLDFNPELTRADADKLEANAGGWLLPKVRNRYREGRL